MPYITLTDGTQVHYRGAANLSPDEQAQLRTIMETAIARVTEADRRRELARRAFYGGHTALDNYLREAHGHIWNGHHFPIISVDLADYIKWVQELDTETLDRLCDEATP